MAIKKPQVESPVAGDHAAETYSLIGAGALIWRGTKVNCTARMVHLPS